MGQMEFYPCDCLPQAWGGGRKHHKSLMVEQPSIGPSWSFQGMIKHMDSQCSPLDIPEEVSEEIRHLSFLGSIVSCSMWGEESISS